MSARTTDRGSGASRRASLVLGIVLAGLASAAVGDTSRVKTGRGTFLVEIDAPGMTARADGDDLVVVGPGDEELRIKPDPEETSFAARDPILTLRRGGKPVVTVRRVGSRRIAPVAAGPGRTILGKGRLPGAWSLAITPDGRTLASGHEGSIRLWDLATKAERLNIPTGKTVRRVALTPDGATIASVEYAFEAGNPVGRVAVRDGKTGEARRLGKLVNAGLHGVAIDREAKVIVTSAWTQNELHVWDAESAAEVGTLKGHTGVAATLAYSPDGKTLASAGDTTIRLWDVNDGTTRRVLRGHTRTVESVAYSLDGKTIASGGFDETARAWDAETGRLLATFECENPVLSVAISPDGRTLASASARWGDGFYDASPAEVEIWDVPSSKRVAKLPDQPNQIFAMIITPDGKSLITASLSGAVILWDLAAPGTR